MITLYGVVGPNVAKTRASLLFKQLKFLHVNVDLINQSDEFRKLTPIGRIPVISDDGTVVCDSLFIAEYLDRKYPHSPRLLPERLELRVKAYTIFALLERLYTIASPLMATALGFFDLVDPVTGACSGYYPVEEDLRSELASALEERLQSLDALLGGDAYFAGPTCSQADFAVFAFLSLLTQIGVGAGAIANWMNERTQEFPFDDMFAPADVAVARAI